MAVPYTGIDYIADQLRASVPDANWDAADVDRARELASALWVSGIRDLSKLKLVRVTSPPLYSWMETGDYDQSPMYAFEYEGRHYGYLGEIDRLRNEPVLEADQGRYRVLWSAAGHGAVSYFVVPRGNGFAFYPVWGSTSDLPYIREVAMTSAIVYASFILPIAGISPANQIGYAVLGTSASPAVAALVGNIALSTAFNGGNIEEAVKSGLKSAAIGEISGLAGAEVKDLADDPLVGKLAAAGVRAKLSGGDVDQAVAMTLLQNGGDVVDWFSSDTDVNTPSGGDFSGDPYAPDFEYTPPDAQTFGGDFSGDPYAPGFDYTPPDVPTDTPPDVAFSDEITDRPIRGGIWTDTPSAPTTAVDTAPDPDRPIRGQLIGINVEGPQPPKSDSFNWATARDVINTVSTAALSAIKLNQAFNGGSSSGQGGGGTVVTQSRSVQPNGSVVSGLSDGTVQTRTPDGRVSVGRPPVGVAQATVDGKVVINNGDGTYDLISNTGQRRTIQYGENTGSDGFDITKVPLSVWLGVGGLLVSIIK